MPLYSADGKLKTDTVMLPGRHACQCLAQKHKLINNCMYCGRIVCEQEGSGISPVDFCFSKFLLMGKMQMYLTGKSILKVIIKNTGLMC